MAFAKSPQGVRPTLPPSFLAAPRALSPCDRFKKRLLQRSHTPDTVQHKSSVVPQQQQQQQKTLISTQACHTHTPQVKPHTLFP